jgi:hypothetical protein
VQRGSGKGERHDRPDKRKHVWAHVSDTTWKREERDQSGCYTYDLRFGLSDLVSSSCLIPLLILDLFLAVAKEKHPEMHVGRGTVIELCIRCMHDSDSTAGVSRRWTCSDFSICREIDRSHDDNLQYISI